MTTAELIAPDHRPTGRRRVFVYYRVGAAQAGAAIEHVMRMQELLCGRHAGLRAEAMRRPDATDGHVTLMETYARDGAVSAEGVDVALQDGIESEMTRAMAPWTMGPRHVEVFEACA